ncbi:hypothetical protein C8J56DRAFT_1060104 [Mycena floridula]|nr:hypothetical protein C8J56DRAFT_1060104 [Mycena floridula]
MSLIDLYFARVNLFLPLLLPAQINIRESQRAKFEYLDVEKSLDTVNVLPNEDSASPELSRKTLILIAVSSALFFDVCSSCAAITLLPTLEKDLQFSASALQWVISAYILTIASFMLVAARISDFSIRNLFSLQDLASVGYWGYQLD